MSMPHDVNVLSDARRTLRRIDGIASAGGTLHVWFKAVSTAKLASLDVVVDGRQVAALATANADEFVFHAVELAVGGILTIAFDPDTTLVSVAYVFSTADVAHAGITLLAAAPETTAPVLPGSYHFRPPFGWMNDPNGFGRFGGLGHLFYQHYPHGLRWNTMHWGHAVSDDLLRWRHQPVFLFPSAELSAKADGRGGAFSGSAIPGPEGRGVRVFYTEQVKGRTPEEQIQFAAYSADGIAAGPPTLILPERPPGLGLTSDFRDPYVVMGPDRRWKMLVGSRDHAAGVVLLYETNDPTGGLGWTFCGVLHREERFGMTAAECPCLLPLDGPAEDPVTRWTLFFGLLTSRDAATGRRNMTLAAVGRFDGRTFTPEFEQELDFGTDAYAFQAFLDVDGPVGIAWLANWTDISKTLDFPTAMTLPRRMVLRQGTLATPPIKAVETLRRGGLHTSGLLAGRSMDLGNGAAEILLDLARPGAPFDLDLSCSGLECGVRLDETGLTIRYQLDDGRPAPRYCALGATPSSIRIFLDAGSIEVFANDGRWTGTKRLKDLAVPTGAKLHAEPGAVTAARAYALAL
jgi:beta-fructofuranosidase